jgi:amidase
MLAFLTERFGRQTFGAGFVPAQLDGLSQGLAAHYRRHWKRTPGVLYRLRRTRAEAAALTRRYAVILSPVLAHPAPALGHLTPEQPFETLLQRLMHYVAFTPLNNTNGTPAMALPAGLSAAGLPLSVQLSAGHGEERRLLELAYALEAEQPFLRITDG